VRILVTRPELDAKRTAAALRAHGHQVVLAPLLSVETVADADLGAGPFAAVLFTSANAVRAVAGHPRRAELVPLPVFTVGRRSALAARAAGFRNIISADGGAEDLVRLVRARAPGLDGPLLYPAGADRARELTGELAAAGIVVRTVVLYRAVKAAHPLPELVRALATNQVDAVLHFSRRSVEAYLDVAVAAGLLNQALVPKHYCLSAQVAGPLISAGAPQVHVSPRPEELHLLALFGVRSSDLARNPGG
jgi:uroporphyrinogen-III synthase